MNGKALEARSGPKTAGQIRLPFFYGWLLVGVSFVTMAIGVNARAAYSLLFPQILEVMLAAILGGAAGPWLAGTLHDLTGSYSLVFWLSIGCSAFSAISIWRAAPRRGGGVRVEGGD
jgi:hypothetical protein